MLTRHASNVTIGKRMPSSAAARRPWRQQLEQIIFGVDTRAGRAFDLVLLILIVLSTVVVVLESVPAIRQQHGAILRAAEWMFTILFTVEYVLRIISFRKPLLYATSFLGMVDLVAVLPTYASVLLPGTQTLGVIRSIRLLRVFRVLKLGRYLGEAQTLGIALRRSRVKITVFLFAVLTVVIVVGAAMYLIEGEASGFTSIPTSMYWAIVTMTTVGYGDIAPQTVPGRLLASLLMILGYGVIAVPTGIVSVELADASHQLQQKLARVRCDKCHAGSHDADATHCKYCGTPLNATGAGEEVSPAPE